MSKILAIDDQQDNLTTVQALLKIKMPECIVYTALSGPEGIKTAGSELPDVILLDIKMPNMDGYEVCSNLKNDIRTKHIPIIMLTAIRTDAESRVKAFDLGADAFLSKPIDPIEFAAQIKAMLRIKMAEDKLRAEKKILERTVKQRTNELEEKNSILEAELVQREIMAQMLVESEAKYKALYDNSPMAYQSLAIDGAFYDVNPAWLNILGYKREEVIGKKFFDFLHPESAKTAEEEIFPGFKKCGFIHNVEFKIRHKKGHYIDILYEGCAGYYPNGTFKQTYCVFQDITAKKLAQNALRYEQEFVQKVLDSLPGIFYLYSYPEMKLVRWNKNHEIILGYSAEELNNMDVGNWIINESKIAVQKAMNEIIEKGSLATELNLYTKDRKAVPFILTSVKFESKGEQYILGVGIDNSRFKKSENELIEQKLLFETMFETIADGVVITNTKREILIANQGMEKTFGYKPEELIGKTTELLYADEIKYKKEGLTNFNDNSISDDKLYVTYYKKKNNEIFPGETFGTKLFDKKGNWIGNLGIMRDITERSNFIKEISIARAKAEENDQLKTAFLANMSHEIRTPMNAVIGFSQLLLRDNIEPKEKQMFSEYIRINGESLLKIIDDVIDISKIQSKQLTIKNTDFNLNGIFKELVSYYDRLLTQKIKKNIELELNIPQEKETPFYVKSDEIRLKQILNNLISNAIKYAGKCKIIFGYNIQNNQLHFFVKDTGKGISAANLAQIFDRFFQFSDEYISRQDGTGLGLPISKELVALLGGELKVESKIGLGSTFYFNIPLIQSTPKNIDILTTHSDVKPLDLSNFKILIVDDEESNYVLTNRILRETNVKTDWAYNGLKAIDMVLNTSYDLILMDIKMPDMNGIEATQIIRTKKIDVPIIIQTAFAMPQVKEEAFSVGCDDFVIKPVGLEDFLSLVTKYILKNQKV